MRKLEPASWNLALWDSAWGGLLGMRFPHCSSEDQTLGFPALSLKQSSSKWRTCQRKTLSPLDNSSFGFFDWKSSTGQCYLKQKNDFSYYYKSNPSSLTGTKITKMLINIMKKKNWILIIFHPKRTTVVLPYLFLCLEESHYPGIEGTGSLSWTRILDTHVGAALLNLLSLISSIVKWK